MQRNQVFNRMASDGSFIYWGCYVRWMEVFGSIPLQLSKRLALTVACILMPTFYMDNKSKLHVSIVAFLWFTERIVSVFQCFCI